MFSLSQLYNPAFRRFLSMPTACFYSCLPHIPTYLMFTPAAWFIYAYRVFYDRLPRII